MEGILLYADHKPLEGLFGESTPGPPRASARILRWALPLSEHDYEFDYKPGKALDNVDTLGRLPLLDSPPKQPQPTKAIFLIELLSTSLIDAAQLKKERETHYCLECRERLQMAGHRWQSQSANLISPEKSLCVQDGCLLLGSWVIRPPVE